MPKRLKAAKKKTTTTITIDSQYKDVQHSVPASNNVAIHPSTTVHIHSLRASILVYMYTNQILN